MATVIFSTLKFANQLKPLEFRPLKQKPKLKPYQRFLRLNLSELATKEDLHHEIKELELHIDTRF